MGAVAATDETTTMVGEAVTAPGSGAESLERAGSMTIAIGADPAETARAFLVPGYVFPPDGGGALEAPEGSALATYAPVFRKDGGQSGYYALLSADGEILVFDDPSSAPDEGFVFIPYYANTGGSGTMLTLGYFQLVNGALVQRSSIFVDDRADWKGLDYLGEGQFVIRALTHGADQPMADAPDTPLSIMIERVGDTVVETGRGGETEMSPEGSDEAGVLWITPDGLGPITAQSTYSDVNLSGFLPSAALIRTDEVMGEAGMYSTLAFDTESGIVRVDYLLDGPLVSISSTDPGIGSELGIWPGDKMVDHWEGMECAPGLEVFAAGMICSKPGTPHLAVYFSGPTPGNVPDGWMPAADDPLARKWIAEQVLWLDDVDMAREYRP
ncbi:hypothetical protein [Pelagibacterium halotolerans]|uniref:hypothetical protein n=1 Tax=Pelagibacterium halotolerans TaxID=531813 RepID=UPI00384A5862